MWIVSPEPGMFNLTVVVSVLIPACLGNVNNTKSKFVSELFVVSCQLIIYGFLEESDMNGEFYNSEQVLIYKSNPDS